MELRLRVPQELYLLRLDFGLPQSAYSVLQERFVLVIQSVLSIVPLESTVPDSTLLLLTLQF